MSDLSKRDLLKLSLRLMFIQSAWSASSMQAEGFVYGIAPALRRLIPDPEKRRRALKHYRFPINTHPFLAGVLAGAVLKMERDAKTTKTIVTYLRSTMGPLAAMGDPFFHSGVTPFAGVIAALVAWVFGSLAGIIAIIVIFNAIHMAFRISAVFTGYRYGEQALTVIGHWMSPAKTLWLKTITALLAGLLLAVVLFCPELGPVVTQLWRPVAVGVAALILALVLSKRRSSWVFLMPAFLLAALITEAIIPA